MQVVGVGGGGSNAVNRMLANQLTGVEMYVMNTDAQVSRNILLLAKLIPACPCGLAVRCSCALPLCSAYSPLCMHTQLTVVPGCANPNCPCLAVSAAVAHALTERLVLC
jgi:hypothetical protein